MKSASSILLLTLLLMGFAVPISTVAEGDGPSASGTYEVSVDKSTSREITFNATSAGDGTTTGEITFRDISKVSPPKAVTEQEPGEDADFYAKAKCDCLKINGVEAVMSGTVTESSRESYV